MPDPYYGNIGVLVGSLQGISETRMMKALNDGPIDWATILSGFEDEMGQGEILCPTEAYRMHIKVCDFGRGNVSTTIHTESLSTDWPPSIHAPSERSKRQARPSASRTQPNTLTLARSGHI